MQHKDPQLMEKIRLFAMNYYREHNQMPSIRTIADGTGMTDINAVIKQADQEMYTAKRNFYMKSGTDRRRW